MEHTKWEIIEAIGANGIQRNFSVLGGEPLAPQNIQMTAEVVDAVRHAYPKITIYLWTGYEFDDLILNLTEELQQILRAINVLIDGPFIEELKDLSLKLRGSSNQHIRIKRNNEWELAK
jgi:anaerobic ribonucleoside-triphosphate reductase activating protein